MTLNFKMIRNVDGGTAVVKADYKIVRFYRNDKPCRTIKTGLTLGEAQAHCSDSATSTPEYFDGYADA